MNLADANSRNSSRPGRIPLQCIGHCGRERGIVFTAVTILPHREHGGYGERIYRITLRCSCSPL